MPPFELEALEKHPDEGPVTMVNLLKFRDESLDGNGSGRDAYNRYAAVAMQLALESPENDSEYNWLALNQTAIRSGWVNPDSLHSAYKLHRLILEIAPYFEANQHRTNGTEKHLILATKTRIAADFPEALR